MRKEFGNLRKFEVIDDKDSSTLNADELSKCVKTRRVYTWRGFAKSRLAFQTYSQQISGLDETYASTPKVSTPRLHLHLALQNRRYMVVSCRCSK